MVGAGARACVRVRMCVKSQPTTPRPHFFLSRPRYLHWLTSDLVFGLWNVGFVATNVGLFLAMPFAYFFFEVCGWLLALFPCCLCVVSSIRTVVL